MCIPMKLNLLFQGTVDSVDLLVASETGASSPLSIRGF